MPAQSLTSPSIFLLHIYPSNYIPQVEVWDVCASKDISQKAKADGGRDRETYLPPAESSALLKLKRIREKGGWEQMGRKYGLSTTIVLFQIFRVQS